MRIVHLFPFLIAFAACATARPANDPWPLPQEPHGEAGAQASRDARTPAGHADVVGHHFVNLFLGATFEGSREGPTIGAGYEYRLSELWGVGAFAEFAGGGFDNWVVGAGPNLHPWRDLILFVMPGFEREHGHWDPMLRLGGGYEFPMDAFTLTPSAAVDFVSGGHQVFVLGVALGRKF